MSTSVQTLKSWVRFLLNTWLILHFPSVCLLSPACSDLAEKLTLAWGPLPIVCRIHDDSDGQETTVFLSQKNCSGDCNWEDLGSNFIWDQSTAHTWTKPQHYKTTQVSRIQNRKRLREQVTRQKQDIKTLTRKPRNNGHETPETQAHQYSAGGNTIHTWTTGEDDMDNLLWKITFNTTYSQKKKLHGLSPRANYTDRATAACRRSDCQLLTMYW
jgi:hypothetical protein